MTKLFPESEDEEDNAVCTDIASRDEVVSPTPQAEELANCMFELQNVFTTFVDSTIAGEKLLDNKIHRMESRLDHQLEMIKVLQQQVGDTINKVEDLMSWHKDIHDSIESDWLKQEVEDSIKNDWLQEEVERLVWRTCEEAKEDIKDETRDFVAEETKNDYQDKFDEIFGKLEDQFRKIDESIAKVLKK